jgi:predicted  nucleic acid-binding Zn-ribbon protein
LAQINSQRNQTAISVNNIVQGAYDLINTTVKAFSNNVSSLNASIYNTLNSSALLQARLDNLQAQINGTASLVGNSTDASLLSDLVSRYGANMAQEVQDLMNSSHSQLSEAQKTAVLQQLVTANSALGAASGLNSTGTALASAVQAVINQVKAASSSMQANTDALNAKLNIVSLSANNTVAISANQIAAIISKYSQDAASTQTAIAAQFAAAGNASITVQAALKVFDSLKDSALNLTTDQLEDLKQTQSEVFDFTDDLLHKAQSQADSDVKNLTDSMTDINKRLSHSHQSNMAIVDSLLAQLNQIAANAADQKSGFEQQVGNLRGSVNSLINQLNARYTSITAQGAQFKSAVESAAAQDIAALTVNG